MSKKNIVQHLEHGLKVQCADGAVIHCRPLMLGEAKFFLEQFEFLESEDSAEKGMARIRIARRFADCYPELADHVGMGDVEDILVNFFAQATGAMVVRENGRTGTPSGRNTSPTGEVSQT